MDKVETMKWAIEQIAQVHRGTGMTTEGVLREAKKLYDAVWCVLDPESQE